MDVKGFKRKIEADGFDSVTNTFYEFYGDEFYGNLKIRNLDGISRVYHKTYKELYENTMKRERLIKEAGYNLITIWENDWDIVYKNSLKIEEGKK
ncbi:MAG: hypothetical protein WC516_04355 [Patescibacteria group bacterium]